MGNTLDLVIYKIYKKPQLKNSVVCIQDQIKIKN